MRLLTLLLLLADPWQVPPNSLPATVASLRAAADAAFGAPTAEHLAALQAGVAAPELVSGERRYDLRWLQAAATSGEPRALFAAREQLKAWERSLGDRPAASPVRVSATARQILSAEAYQPVRANAWIDPWLPAIERFLDLLLAPLSRRGAENGPGRDLLAVLSYGILTVALAALLIRVSRRRRRQPGPPAPELGQPPTLRRSADDWREAARREQAAGRGGVALAALCRAALRRLEETGRLPDRPGRTLREAAAELTGPSAAAVGALARRAETVFYGGGDLSPAELAAAGGELERMWDS